jgi:hypothetical protein
VTSNARSLTLALLLGFTCLVAAPGRAQVADSGWRILAIEEDDIWAPRNQDRHYTHGVRLDATSGDLLDPTYQRAFEILPNFPNGGERSRRFEFMLGQNIYTPEDLSLIRPDPRDRPYAGWLYVGFGLMQNTDRRQLDRLVLRLGTVGKSSEAGSTQISFHTIIDARRPKGWAYQVKDEATLDLYAERKWRTIAHLIPKDGIAVDLIPQVGVRAGNVFDYVSAGGMVRFGRNLANDYGPPHIDENLGSSEINPAYGEGNWAWYVFAGAEGRLIARNIFLDGNTFKTSPNVATKRLVGDLEAGIAILYSHLRIGYTLVQRSKEFDSQVGIDQFGSINLGFRISF